jgi:hypothetical protein
MEQARAKTQKFGEFMQGKFDNQFNANLQRQAKLSPVQRAQETMSEFVNRQSVLIGGTVLAVFVIMMTLQPAMVRKPRKNDIEDGDVCMRTVLLWALFAGGLVWGLPYVMDMSGQ